MRTTTSGTHLIGSCRQYRLTTSSHDAGNDCHKISTHIAPPDSPPLLQLHTCSWLRVATSVRTACFTR